MSELSSLLSVLVVTSPIGVHPSTEVIDQTLASLQLIPELSPCSLFILCDGVRISLDHLNEYKQGVVTADTADRYTAYKATLLTRYAAHPTITVHPLPERVGFGYAVHAGLELIHTPFALIVQHDYVFTHAPPIDRLTRLMASHTAGQQAINYIGFLSRPTLNYYAHSKQHYDMQRTPEHQLHSFHDDSTAAAAEVAEGGSCAPPRSPITLCPLFFWFDKNHLASTRYYRTVVFQQRTWWGVKRGRFIEDTFGQKMSQRIKNRGLQAWKEFGSFLYCPNGQDRQITLRHTHGRMYLTAETKSRLQEESVMKPRGEPVEDQLQLEAVREAEWLAG